MAVNKTCNSNPLSGALPANSDVTPSWWVGRELQPASMGGGQLAQQDKAAARQAAAVDLHAVRGIDARGTAAHSRPLAGGTAVAGVLEARRKDGIGDSRANHYGSPVTQ